MRTRGLPSSPFWTMGLTVARSRLCGGTDGRSHDINTSCYIGFADGGSTVSAVLDGGGQGLNLLK